MGYNSRLVLGGTSILIYHLGKIKIKTLKNVSLGKGIYRLSQTRQG
jgi:hypothetical protein